MKTKKDFIKAELNTQSLTLSQWDGIKRAMENFKNYEKEQLKVLIVTHDCRCTYCKNVYGKDEDFHEHNDRPICDKCYVEVLEDKLKKLNQKVEFKKQQQKQVQIIDDFDQLVELRYKLCYNNDYCLRHNSKV